MKKLNLLFGCSILILLVTAGGALSELDYTIGGSRNGKGIAVISEETSHHGSHSLMLSAVGEKGKYARIYANFDDPAPIEDLNQLSMWLLPAKGRGKVALDIYFHGGGKLSSSKLWSERELGQWMMMDAFHLPFNFNTKTQNKTLREWQDALKGKKVNKIWIRLYCENNPSASAYFDYLKIGHHIISFEPLEREEILDAPKSVSPGEKISYIITYGNNLQEPIDLVIVERYDPGIIFQWSDPLPDTGTNNIWTIRDLPPGKFGQIKIVARTSKLACKADISGSVIGKGMASVSRELSTNQPGRQVVNYVTINSAKFSISAKATTAINLVAGYISSFDEHGSGSYSSKDSINYAPSKISVKQDMIVKESSAPFNLSDSALFYNSSWYANHECGSRISGSSIRESYLNAEFLNLSREAGLHSASSASRRETWMVSESNFSGIAEYDMRRKDIAAYEMLIGSFEIINKGSAWKNTSRQYPKKEWLQCCPEDREIKDSEDYQDEAD